MGAVTTRFSLAMHKQAMHKQAFRPTYNQCHPQRYQISVSFRTVSRSISLSTRHLGVTKKWLLNRHQCIALLYHCVTNESTYFFYAAFEKIQSKSVSPYKMLTDMSPVKLCVWFHNKIQQLINKKKIMISILYCQGGTNHTTGV
jgi:hypothetical protein